MISVDTGRELGGSLRVDLSFFIWRLLDVRYPLYQGVKSWKKCNVSLPSYVLKAINNTFIKTGVDFGCIGRYFVTIHHGWQPKAKTHTIIISTGAVILLNGNWYPILSVMYLCIDNTQGPVSI